MKLPRWLVVVLLATSAATVPAAAAWWWITWPARTLQNFTTLLEQGRFEEASQFLPPTARLIVETADGREFLSFKNDRANPGMAGMALYSPASWREWCTLANLQTEPRTAGDFLRARQRFVVFRLKWHTGEVRLAVSREMSP